MASSPVRSRLAKIGLLVFGLALAVYLGARGPREQHVRIVLGDGARDVTALEIQYGHDETDVARDARFTFEAGSAPRVVSHDPKLPDGDYRLRIEIDARGRRVSVRRQVTLGGGSTQVDVSAALLHDAS